MTGRDVVIISWLNKQVEACSDVLCIDGYKYGTETRDVIIYDVKSYFHLAEILDIVPCYIEFDETFEMAGLYEFIYRDTKIRCCVSKEEKEQIENGEL